MNLRPLTFLIIGIALMLNACSSGGGGSSSTTNQPPVFTSGTAISVGQNTTETGYTAAAYDPEGTTVTYSLTGGTDQGSFNIGIVTGVLTFKTAPSYNTPTDSDANNTYVVQITATDGLKTTSLTVTVTVTPLTLTPSNPASSPPTSAYFKTIQFDWPIYTGATHYKLWVNPTGASGYTLLNGTLTSTSTTIQVPVHTTDWVNALYMLEAYDDSGGAALTSVTTSITSLMLSSIGYLKADNTNIGDLFGRAISLSSDGTTLAVGAYAEDSDATGTHSDSSAVDNNNMATSGAVYIFSFNGTTWSQQAYIKASNTGAGDSFGWSVSLSSNGNTLAVGAYLEDSAATGTTSGNQIDDCGGALTNCASSSGAVYVFTRSGSTWTQQAYIKASNTGKDDNFGYGVALSSDGNTMAVGAPGESSSHQGITTDGTGESDDTASGAGAAYVFSRSGSTWSQDAYVKASNAGATDNFGEVVRLSDDGATLAVGAPREDSAATNVGGTQTEDCGVPTNCATDSGAVYVFFNSSGWSQQAYVKASNTEAGDAFGGYPIGYASLSLSGDGNTLAVGAVREDSASTGIGGTQTEDCGVPTNCATDSGAVYVYTRDSFGTWTTQEYIKASNTEAGDQFGYSVSLSTNGDTLAVGAYAEASNYQGVSMDGTGETNNTDGGAGAAYVFTRSGATWSQKSYVKAPNTGASDAFGSDICLSGDGNTMAVGAVGESSMATGVGGNQADDTYGNSGAAYLY